MCFDRSNNDKPITEGGGVGLSTLSKLHMRYSVCLKILIKAFPFFYFQIIHKKFSIARYRQPGNANSHVILGEKEISIKFK